MQETIKIVFTGSVGAGKTQAIEILSDIEVVSTDVDASDEVRELKEQTTVAMDYGEVQLDESTLLALYGTPGQKRFSYMWDILAKGALGIVIMIDARRPSPLRDLQMYLDNFRKYIDESCLLVAVTHSDQVPDFNSKPLQDLLQKENLPYPIFNIDARNQKQVLLLIESMVAILQAA